MTEQPRVAAEGVAPRLTDDHIVGHSPARPALSRRGFVSLGVGALAVASLPVAMWRRRQVTRRTLPVMGTIADLVVVSKSDAVGQGALDAAMAELRRVEALMTRFTATSDIGRVNLARAGDAVAVSAETAMVVAEALAWADSARGAYDPAVGAAVELWDVSHRHVPPPNALVSALAGREFHREVEIGRSRGRTVVVRHDAAAHLDLGSIAKGYGVDRAATVLREWGMTNAVVDVGGEVYAIGEGIDGGGWRIGIRSPDSPDDVVRVFRLSDAAVATSGTYMQYFKYHGRRYHHLIDPQVAAPRATLVRSFTVQADSCMHADAASTACYGMPLTRASEVMGRRAPGSRVVSTI